MSRILLLPIAVLLFSLPLKADPPASPSTNPTDLIQKHFQLVVSSTTKVALIENTANFKKAIIEQKISSRDLATSVLNFAAQTRNHTIIFLIEPVLTATEDPLEFARVWTAALSSDDKNIRQIAPSLLQFLERSSSRNEPNFDLYTSLLAKDPTHMSIPLIQYMYNQSRSQAFLAILAATGDASSPEKKKASILRERELQLAHHMIEHAVWLLRNNSPQNREEALKVASTHISALADAPEWWVRYYIAALLLAHTDFQTDALNKKLSTDKNETVRTLAKPLAPAPQTQPAN